MTFLASSDPMDHVLPHVVGRFGSVSIPNQLLMLVVAAVLMLLVFPVAARAQGVVPRGMRNLVESVLQYLRENVARPVLRESTDRYVPFLWTMFFLILFSNLLGMLPVDPLAASTSGPPRCRQAL